MSRPDLIDGKTAARLLNVSRPTLNRLARSGELPSFRFGGGNIYLRSDVEAIAAERAKAGAA